MALIRQTARKWKDDNVPRLSAALSYYAIFSLSPMVVVILAVGGMWIGAEEARERLNTQMETAVGTTTAGAVSELVGERSERAFSGYAAVGGLVFLFFGATRFFGELQEAINAMWGVDGKKRKAVRAWSRKRMLSFAMLGILMLLLIASSLFSVAVAASADAMDRWIAIDPVLWTGVGMGVGLAMETVLFAVMFYMLPEVKFPLRDVWLGAGMTAVLFEMGKWALGWFLARDGATSFYGAASSVMIVLLWVYFTSLIVLTGAEFTQVYSRWRRQGE